MCQQIVAINGRTMLATRGDRFAIPIVNLKEGEAGRRCFSRDELAARDLLESNGVDPFF
jgi:hypothetical protein